VATFDFMDANRGLYLHIRARCPAESHRQFTDQRPLFVFAEYAFEHLGIDQWHLFSPVIN
jgi:hypothetical protein